MESAHPGECLGYSPGVTSYLALVRRPGPGTEARAALSRHGTAVGHPFICIVLYISRKVGGRQARPGRGVGRSAAAGKARGLVLWAESCLGPAHSPSALPLQSFPNPPEHLPPRRAAKGSGRGAGADGGSGAGRGAGVASPGCDWPARGGAVGFAGSRGEEGRGPRGGGAGADWRVRSGRDCGPGRPAAVGGPGRCPRPAAGVAGQGVA